MPYISPTIKQEAIVLAHKTQNHIAITGSELERKCNKPRIHYRSRNYSLCISPHNNERRQH